MKTYRLALVILVIFTVGCRQQRSFTAQTAESNGYTYSYVENDPLKVRIYTLKNGLKVYLSQYAGEPRIQTQIAVKAGGKNDPADNTGLAHYLEHIMFKGTPDFGTLDWKTEATYLDSIEHMFAHYGTLKEAAARKEYYTLIDKVSNEASKYAIANEYDKMVSEIGANGTNAYTSEDRTVYVNEIPSNQLENWLQIEGNRFRTIVPRLFHTELEAVYEEKNMGLDNDYVKAYEAMYENLFPGHPYGTQTVIGTIDHLKNPSITAIKKYFSTYYRPNNVAICMSGDLDYDKTIALVDKYFGDWQPNPDLQAWQKPTAQPIAKPVVKDVYGPDAEWVSIGYRFDGRSSDDYTMLALVNLLLTNEQAGLIDINLKQQQKVLEPSSYIDANNDYCVHTFTARPREGQTLEQAKDLLLGQVELLKKGDFDDWLIEASINNMKMQAVERSENNEARVNELVMAFTNNIPWEKYIASVEALKKVDKAAVTKFAQQHYGDNYVVIYKHNGKDPNAQKVDKPSITKVQLNKEAKSPFHEQLLKRPVDKLKPQFVDYNKDIQKTKMNKDVEVITTPNRENDLFLLFFLSDVGTTSDPRMSVAVDYLQYLGTPDMPVEEIKKQFYKLGCEFGVFAGDDQTYIYLTGLDENMDAALKLFENLLANAQPDPEALQKMIDGKFKEREDRKKDKQSILFGGLMNYGLYGPKSAFTNVLSNKALRGVTAGELVAIIRDFTKTQHRVLYYGKRAQHDLVAVLNAEHKLPDQLKPAPPQVKFEMQDVNKPVAYWADYDMVQEEIMFLSKGNVFDKARIPMAEMFDEYLGGNMSSPVFQELREAQGLAYSAFTYYGTADKATDNDFFFAYIGTQADKQPEAMKAMQALISEMPRAQSNFDVARNALLSRIESERITKSDILFDYIEATKRNLDYDIRRDVYDQVQRFTLDDVTKFQQQYIKGRPANVVVVGARDKIDFKALQKYGEVKELSLDEIFGYEKVEKVNLERPQ